jgi:glycerate kinase
MRVKGPTGEPVDSFYGLIDDGQTAVIEMAAASGLALVPRSKRNPMRTTSYGTGELIRHALDRGVRKLILGIGGSATNEGGMGALTALGLTFFDKDGAVLGHTASDMLKVASIAVDLLDPRLRRVEIEVACDVNNPLCGQTGASHVFGPQKGATPEMIAELDTGLWRYAQRIAEALHTDILNVPGAGASGGLGGALVAIGGRLRMGTDIVIDAVNLRERVQLADILITGEGATDASTPFGKVPVAMGALARQRGIKCVCIAGSALKGYRPVYDQGVTAVFSIMNRPMTMEQAIKNAFPLVMECTENVARAMGL